MARKGCAANRASCPCPPGAQAVKNVSLSNRTVMVTIHQPSMDIFEQFTELVLLQRGGRLTYFGPLGDESAALIEYLEGQPGVEPIK